MLYPAMLSFRPLQMSDASLIRSFLQHFRERLCDYTMSGLLLWRDYFRTEIAIDGELLFVRHIIRGANQTVFGYPQGPEPLRHNGVERILAHCRENGEKPVLCNVTAGELNILQSQYAVRSANPERDWFDYLYAAEDLAEMAGRRYAGQRNHISQFRRAFPEARYEPLSAGLIEPAKAFLGHLAARQEHPTDMLLEEYRALNEVLENLSAYGVFGGLLMDGERVLALSLGETLGNTMFVHTEKADPDAPGAYQMIAREFARHNAEGLRWINREEDMGIEGLRQSKLRYHPSELLEKNTVELDTAYPPFGKGSTLKPGLHDRM